jgi:hypothetical protein
LKNLPKVNNHPLGENSPNLVTLFLCLRATGRQKKFLKLRFRKIGPSFEKTVVSVKNMEIGFSQTAQLQRPDNSAYEKPSG